MPPEVAKLLWDMLDAANKIARFCKGRTREDFMTDDLLRSAVERQFITIGEAMTRLLQVDEKTGQSISEYRKIKSFRNVIVHGYDTIDDETSWSIIEKKLPVLQRELEELLKDS